MHGNHWYPPVKPTQSAERALDALPGWRERRS